MGLAEVYGSVMMPVCGYQSGCLASDRMWLWHGKLLSLRWSLVSVPVHSRTMGQAEDNMAYWWFLSRSETKPLAFARRWAY